MEERGQKIDDDHEGDPTREKKKKKKKKRRGRWSWNEGWSGSGSGRWTKFCGWDVGGKRTLMLIPMMLMVMVPMELELVFHLPLSFPPPLSLRLLLFFLSVLHFWKLFSSSSSRCPDQDSRVESNPATATSNKSKDRCDTTLTRDGRKVTAKVNTKVD